MPSLTEDGTMDLRKVTMSSSWMPDMARTGDDPETRSWQSVRCVRHGPWGCALQLRITLYSDGTWVCQLMADGWPGDPRRSHDLTAYTSDGIIPRVDLLWMKLLSMCRHMTDDDRCRIMMVVERGEAMDREEAERWAESPERPTGRGPHEAPAKPDTDLALARAIADLRDLIDRERQEVTDMRKRVAALEAMHHPAHPHRDC